MKTVEGAHNVTERKGSDQTLLDPVALERRDSRVARLGLEAVEKFKPAKLQTAGVAKHIMKAKVNLFRKHHRRISLFAVGDVIAGAQPELPLRSGSHGICRQVQQDWRLDLDHPVEATECLTDSQPDDGVVQRVFRIAGR